MEEKVIASCHCGSVRLEVEAPLSEITECNCSLRRRYSVLWAYYPPDGVEIVPQEPPTDFYMWNGRRTEFHHCRTCGCVTHWIAANRKSRMVINARLMEPEIVSDARLRHLDGANTNEYLD